MCTPGIKMSITISRLNSSVEECFFSLSLQSYPDNASCIKQGSKDASTGEIAIAISILSQGYPFYLHRSYTNVCVIGKNIRMTWEQMK